MSTSDRHAIKVWMLRNVERFVDRRTGEVDLTPMVEAWDVETQDGGATTDPDHEAWEVAVEVAAESEENRV